MPIFLVFGNLRFTIAGLMITLGRPGDAIWGTLYFVVIAYPLIYYFSFYKSMELEGVWLSIGIGMIVIVLIFCI